MSQVLKIHCLLKEVRFWFLLSYHHLEWEEVAGDTDSFIFSLQTLLHQSMYEATLELACFVQESL